MLAGLLPLYSCYVRILTIVLLFAALLVASCGGGDSPSKPTPVPVQGPFPPPEGENADVVQFLRDYYLTFEDVYSGRTPPAKLIQMYALHCTENLKPGALDVLVLSVSVNRPGANATKITQIDVVNPTVTGVPERPELVNVSLPGERDLGFLIDGHWRSGEEYESLIKSKVPLSTDPVTRELIRIDGKLYISDCDFGRGLPGRPSTRAP